MEKGTALSKKLEQLDAAKAGVSQAILTQAFDTLPMLEKENDEWEGKLETAQENLRTAKVAFAKAREAMRDVLKERDAVAEEWARASWIVRNADPDHPQPPLGAQAPRIKTPRSAG